MLDRLLDPKPEVVGLQQEPFYEETITRSSAQSEQKGRARSLQGKDEPSKQMPAYNRDVSSSCRQTDALSSF